MLGLVLVLVLVLVLACVCVCVCVCVSCCFRLKKTEVRDLGATYTSLQYKDEPVLSCRAPSMLVARGRMVSWMLRRHAESYVKHSWN